MAIVFYHRLPAAAGWTAPDILKDRALDRGRVADARFLHRPRDAGVRVLWNTYSTFADKFERGLASVEFAVLSRQYLHLAHLVSIV